MQLNPYQSIVILGGGTAGWITANLMATHWPDVKITLVEAPDIGIIGVGEGSTPPLKGFMDTVGIAEKDWMPACNATYKVGINFKNWSVKPGFEQYIHPFLCQPDHFSVPGFFHNSYLIRKGVDLEGHPDHFFLASEMIRKNLSPVAPDNFPFEINYGYHFDSGLLGQFLAKHAESKGVVYKKAKVEHVVLKNNGDIDYLETQDGEKIFADLFVDSSGFRGKLIQETLKVPFISYADSLYNDSAVVFATEPEEDISPRTESTALKYGWAWHIPLTNRSGNGYVYSSKYVSHEDAEKEFREHLGIDDSVEARRLSFRVGCVSEHWSKNCLAVGLSQGFIEPLEATALDMVQETVVRFMEAVNQHGNSQRGRQSFNQRITNRFNAIKDYIVCHYRVVSRTDTQYWRDCGSNEKISSSLRSILMTWMQGNNITDELERQKLDAYFPNVSWNCLLAGKGIYPSKAQLKPDAELSAKYPMDKTKRYIEGCALNFENHGKALRTLKNA